MQTNFSHWSLLKLQPIFRLWLIEEPPPSGWSPLTPPSVLVDADAVMLAIPEQETGMTITPITRRTQWGGDRQVGNLLTLTHYTSIQDHTSLQLELAKYVGKRVSAKIQFGGYRRTGSGWFSPHPLPELPGYQERFLYLTKFDSWDARVEVNYRSEPAEFRQRTIVTVQAPLPAGAPLAGLLWSEDSSWW